MSLFSGKMFFQRHFINNITRAIRLKKDVNGNYLNRLGQTFQKNSTRFNSTINSTSKKVEDTKGLKALMKKYGYSALAVYLSISFIDLPLSFLLVHSFGEVKIRVYMNKAKQIFGYGNADEEEYLKEVEANIAQREEDIKSGKYDNAGYWERMKQSTLLTEFIIAYGIHKSLIVLRVPLTAAITPAAVKLLNRYGIKLGNKSNEIFKTMSDSSKIRYKSNDPKVQDFVKNGAAVPRQKKTTGQKWFNGLM